MFSSMIQNLLSSSGKASAMQRAVQMNNYVNTLNAQWAPVEKQKYCCRESAGQDSIL